MTLGEIIAGLAALDDSMTICAEKSPEWTRDSESELLPAAQVPADCRFPYFSEVSVAKDVLRAWSFARSGSVPSHADACETIIHYAENDAYLLPR